MSYQVISRKYRPQRFDEVIGQAHICATLQNALKNDRISHAYLFTGSRGIGKTSTARILAKSLNCTDPKEHDPCNVCRNCIEITAGRSIDVLEIDGASNRGIDQIRDLRENVKYPPAGSKYRIFIIDEVHMLTKEAFNALLKTLEEPPEHVVFIFATTEPLKIPATIISRCQRYDFHRIPIAQIVAHLKTIAGQEGVKISDDILMLIAKKAEGGMRDAESLLDQLIAFSGKEVIISEARKILSLIDYEFYIEIGNEIFQNNKKSLLIMAGKIIDDGINIAEFLSGLSEHFRNILIANTTNSVDMLDLPDNVKSRYYEEAKKWQSGDLLRLIKIISDAQINLRTSLNHRMHLEFTLLRMGAMHSTVTVEEILNTVKTPAYAHIPKQPTPTVKETTDLFQINKSEPKKKEPVPITEPVAAISASVPTKEEIRETPDIQVPVSINLDDIIAKWDAIVQLVAEDSPMFASFLKDGKPQRINGNILEIVFKNGAVFQINTIKSRINTVEEAVKKVTGKYFKIKCIEDKSEAAESTEKNAFDDMTRKVIDIFGGEIIPT